MRAIEANYLASPPARLPEDVDFFDGIDPALVKPMLGVDVEYLREARSIPRVCSSHSTVEIYIESLG